ncbi:hypothetical protein Q8A64_00615 [Oxalobacteraceae bacterium R-40]|uniref:Uncharacterized protein n=1 Tax=Keguizhuia sedimenti TaxID=3064264 RepID=A0ABU1BL77_9BURK|nr:hypothetical protein [Oxalobacteraceae bacterium R-40]
MRQIKGIYVKWMVRARHPNDSPHKAAFRVFRTYLDELRFVRLFQALTENVDHLYKVAAKQQADIRKNNRPVDRATLDPRFAKPSAGWILGRQTVAAHRSGN